MLGRPFVFLSHEHTPTSSANALAGAASARQGWGGEWDCAGAQIGTQGWAVAFRKYSRDYVDAEDEARATGRGLWRGDFEPPWDWRKEHPRGGSPRP